jgi:molybdate transport system ATP-binding protein
VALLGPNGAGKSTVVAALAGLLPLDEGRIRLAGRVLEDPGEGVHVAPERRRVGVVFQDLLLFPHLDVVENVAFGLREQGRPRDEARRQAGAWLERMGLEGLGARRPAELSGGQAQRVALARALAPEPDLLLLDEPLSALDVGSRARIRRVLAAHLAEFPGPRVLITHDPGEAFQLADEIHVMEGGRVTQVGTAEDIRLRPRTPYAADLGGANLFTGTAADGLVRTETGHALTIADPEIDGAVRVSIPPGAVSLHRERPEGSARNRWPTVLEKVEDDGVRVRVLTGAPLPLAVQVTHAACRELELAPGSEVWVSVKASEIGVEPG